MYGPNRQCSPLAFSINMSQTHVWWFVNDRLTWPIRVQRWQSQIMLSVFMRGNQLVVYHVAVCKCQDSNVNKNKIIEKINARKSLHYSSPTSRERRALVLSSTWDGKITWTFSIAHSSLCIITLFLQGALFISLLIFPRRHAPGEAGKFPWERQMNK